MTDRLEEDGLPEEDPMNETDPFLDLPPGDKALIDPDTAQLNEKGDANEKATPYQKRIQMSRELGELMLTNQGGSVGDTISRTRHRPSLPAIKSQFQEAYKRVRTLVEGLSRWEDPVLPEEIMEFKSNVSMATAEDRKLQLIAETLIDLLYHQGACRVPKATYRSPNL